MRRLILFPILLSIGACGAPPEQPNAHADNDRTAENETRAVDASPQPPPATLEQRRIDHLARMKGAIRLHAAADFAYHCGVIDIPEEAFIPIELNGGGLPELAVAFGRVGCSEMGATGFSSTGGSLVQFWHAFREDGPVRMLTEAHMLGFTPGDRQLATQQHGAGCGLPGAAGCRVTYRWADALLGGMTIERKPGGVGERMAHDQLEGRSNIPDSGKRNKAEQLARMRAAIRQDARLNYGERCGPIDIPDDAFIEVELTGDDLPEIAVSLARANCASGGASAFSGTGGALMQFWHMVRDHDGRDGPIRLVLETYMRGFTPAASKLLTIEHQARCPGSVPGFCGVT